MCEGLVAIGLHGGSGGEQAAGVGMLRAYEEVARRGRLDDRAVLHDGDPVGDLADDGQVVRDEEHGEAVAIAQFAEKMEDLGLYGYVEGGGGLVGDEQARAVDDGHRDEDALALAAGELVGIVGEAALGFGQVDVAHGGEDALAHLGARGGGSVDADGLGDLRSDGHYRVQGGHRLLEDHGDIAAAAAAHRVGSEFEQVFAEEADASGDPRAGREQAQDGERGGGFAGAGFADQAESFAGLEGEGDSAYGLVAAEADGEGVDLEDRGLRDRVAGCGGGGWVHCSEW